VASADPFGALVDRALMEFLDERRKQIRALAPDALAVLEEVDRIVRAGGKRIRPRFCYWGHRAGGGGDGDPIVQAAAAVEMLHASALLHDDVMDRSHLRRGEATSYRRLARSGPDGSSERFGQSAAILAGDLAHAFADQLLAESGFPPDMVLAGFARFTRMRVEAVSGEFLDLLAARHPSAPELPSSLPESESAARHVAELKSGSYSVVGPLLMGAALADASPAVMDTLAAFGRPLGEAFQLRDDVLSTFGDPEVTGKDRDTDIREGKHTVLVARAWRGGGPVGRRLIRERLGRANLSPEQIEEVRTMIRDSGALAGTVDLIAELAARAKSELARAPLGPEVIAALGELADLVALREG